MILASTIFETGLKIATKIRREKNENYVEFSFHSISGFLQEGMHTIHCKRLKSVVLKIDLSKSYDRVSQTYLRVLLSKMGFSGPFITWVMGILSSVSFDVLVNGAPQTFSLLLEGYDRVVPFHHYSSYLLWTVSTD